jgi:FkbM family methyltransferase
MSGIKQLIKQSPVGHLAENIQDLFTRNGMYNRQTVQVMRRVLAPDSVCIDIGAHVGSVLREIIAIAPQGNHYAFEPIPGLAQGLREKFPHVELFENALSDQPGQATFQHVTSSPAYSGLRKRVYDGDVQIQEITVDVVRLDDVIPLNAPIRLIKLDIEGGEYHALRGAIGTIQRHRPVIVMEASIGSTGQYDVTPEMFYDLMADELNYKISTMGNWLNHAPAYDRDSFIQNWQDGPEYYFIAVPCDRSL